MFKRNFLVVLALAALPAALAGAAPSSHLEGEFKPERWQFVHDWETLRQTGTEYAHALKFAECVGGFDAEAPSRIMSRPVDDARQRNDLVRLAERFRGCGQRVAVSPFLLRAAFAELTLRQSQEHLARPETSVGVPARIEGFPIQAVAACHVRNSPRLVAELLDTRPGEAAEEDAAIRLFSGTSPCRSPQRVEITPTAVRLAIIHAAFNQR